MPDVLLDLIWDELFQRLSADDKSSLACEGLR